MNLARLYLPCGLRQNILFPHLHFPIRSFSHHNADERSKAISELRSRVSKDRDVWGYMIESFITNISLAERAVEKDVVDMMKACKRDIVDLFPKDQKIITETAWKTIQQVKLEESRDPFIYNLALEAYIYQDMDFDQEEFLSDMKAHKTGPNSRTHENFLTQYAKRGDIESALKMIEERNSAGVVLNEVVASRLILCYLARGEDKEAEDIVSLLEKRQIYYGKSIPNSFVLGVAKRGDGEKLEQFIKRYSPGEQVLLQALVELCKVSPEQAPLILDRLPVNKPFLSSICRRPVKQLLEMNLVDIAEKLVLCTELTPENSSVKENAICISPSVIVVSRILRQATDLVKSIAAINLMKSADPQIISRSIVICFDLCFEYPEKKDFYESVIKELLRENRPALKATEELISQNITRKIQKTRTDNDVLFILKTSSDLGIKLTHLKEWNAALFRLIPGNQEYHTRDLVDRIKSVRNCLDCMTVGSGGVYSNSVLWSQIMKYLLVVKSETFFKGTAILTKDLGVAYGPKRWFDNLGYNLVFLKDVNSYVDILQVAFKNCEKRGDGEDYRQICVSLLVAINTAKKNEENIDKLLEDVFDKMWEKNLLLHQDIKDRIVFALEGETIGEIAQGLPVLGAENFRNARPSTLNYKRKTRRRLIED